MKTAYEYGPNWTKTYEGPAGLASSRWSCSYEDAFGRTICETRPGFRGALLVTSNPTFYVRLDGELFSRRNAA